MTLLEALALMFGGGGKMKTSLYPRRRVKYRQGLRLPVQWPLTLAVVRLVSVGATESTHWQILPSPAEVGCYSHGKVEAYEP
jgi:hypothetical protein